MAHTLIRDYLTLSKPRIALMVGATAGLGFVLSGRPADRALAWTALGAMLASGCCGALNQLLERRQDALMRRTSQRPLAAGRVAPAPALAYGLALGAAGLALVWAHGGALAAGLTAATVLGYVLLYTPLKRVTPQTTWIGAAAGATPPLIGWAAAQGELSTLAWILFAIQFLWQIPHFLAMFWLHREDYARAGFRVMPVVDERGAAAQMAMHSFSVLPASLLPSLLGLAGPLYGFAALGLGAAYLGLGMRASWTLSAVDHRRLFLASLAYLPALFGLLLFGGFR